MRKRVFPAILISVLLLTGCWDSIELNDIAVVTGMAIDPGKDERYRLTVAYMNPAQFSKQNPSQGAAVSIFSLEGNSLPEISARMNIGVSRSLVFSHTRALYINEEIAREGVGIFLDSFERSRNFRNNFNILITKNHDAKQFTMVNDPLEKVPSLKTQKEIKSLVEGWGGDPRVRLNDFIDSIVSKGRSPVASAVIIKGDPKKGENAESNMSIEAPANILLDGMAVFKKDQLIGYLTLDDTRNYLWTQKLKNTQVSIPCHEHEEEKREEQFFDLVLSNNKSVMKTDYKHEKPQLKVNIYAEGRINDMQCPEDISKIKSYEKMEEKASNYIEGIIEATIKKVQKEYGVDIFGFGETLRRQHYDKAKEVEDKWDEEFARGDVEVNVKVAIRRSGTRNKSFLTDLPKDVQKE